MHHVNLGVAGAQLGAEEGFLTDTLGFRRVAPPPELAGRARWFECEDGVQVHLSTEDPGVTPSQRGHVALVLGADLDAVRTRAEAAGLLTEAPDGRPGIVFCTDPAGHRWELRRAG